MRFVWALLCLSFVWPDVSALGQGTPAFFMGQGRTGEKPQAKVWHHNGVWWCLLPGTVANETALRIYHLNDGVWTPGPEVVDARASAQADVWTEGEMLYVLVFHPEETRFLSYAFRQDVGQYRLREGYPTVLSPLPLDGIETMSLRRDGQGRFWAVFQGEQAGAKRGEIRVIWSDDGYHWHLEGIKLGGQVDRDDIATLCRFVIRGTGYVGAIWSQQASNKSTHRDSAGIGRLLMRIHKDGDAPEVWSPLELIMAGQAVADDHLNTAVARDGSIYLVTKTSLDDLRPKAPQVPLLMLHARTPQGVWTNHAVSPSTERGTRPIVTLDDARGILHVFYTAPTNSDQSERAIVHRWSDRTNIKFSQPEQAIAKSGLYLNDATSTHQGVTPEMGILVMCWGKNNKEKTPNRAFFRLYTLDDG